MRRGFFMVEDSIGSDKNLSKNHFKELTYYVIRITIHICGSRSMVEHQLPKLAFAGSIPVSRSINDLP